MKLAELVYNRHQNSPVFPATSAISNWANRLILLLYPEQSQVRIKELERVEHQFDKLEQELTDFLQVMQFPKVRAKECAQYFFREDLAEVYQLLEYDIEAILAGDPAATNRYEVVRAYPGFYAIAFYRVAHCLFKMNIPVIPRILTEYAHGKTGIDIHPGAKIGTHFCIDHGTGVVIGETTEIGNYVKIYQGVTLGALSVEKALSGLKRHPTIQDGVIIYSGATILGGETTIGANSVIGGNVWLTKSVLSCSTVYHKPQIEVKKNIVNCG